MAAAGLPDDEKCERRKAGDRDHDDIRGGPASRRRFDDRPQQEPEPAIESSAPSGSGASAAGLRDSGTTRQAANAPSRASGTLTKNTEPHQNRDSSRPPASGPIAMPTPIVPPHTPTARARSRGSRKTSSRIDRPAGNGHRGTASHHGAKADQHAHAPRRAAPSEPAANTAKPARKTRLRPTRSAMLPATSSRPPNTIA